MQKWLANWILLVLEPKFASIRKGFIRCGREYGANVDRLEYLITFAKRTDQRQARIETILNAIVRESRAVSQGAAEQASYPHELERQYTDALRQYYDRADRQASGLVESEGPISSTERYVDRDYPVCPPSMGLFGGNIPMAQSGLQSASNQAYNGAYRGLGQSVPSVPYGFGVNAQLENNQPYRPDVVSPDPACSSTSRIPGSSSR